MRQYVNPTGVSGVMATPLDQPSVQRWVQRLLWGLTLLIVAYGAYEVWRNWWVCDDAFISFRYAQNLIDGHGLVYNVGERVEGYTNFLWTIILAGFMLLKLDPVPVSMILGALAYFVTAGLLGWLSYRLFRSADKSVSYFFPLAGLAILLVHDYHVFATSGLETSFTAMLATLGFVLLVLARSARTYLWAGIVLILAGVTRPDAMLFYAVGIPYLLLLGKSERRSLLLYLLPLLFMYLPYWIARYLYYGFPFPNTYYAKSADLAYYSQGFAYLWLFAQSYYVLLLVLPALLAALALRFRTALATRLSEPIDRAQILALLFILPYTAYVVRSGGDFMFARFFIPITPLLFFALESSLRRLLPIWWLYAPAALVVLACTFFRWDPFTEVRQVHQIAYEPDYYPRAWVTRAEQVGTKLREYFRGTDTRVAFFGMFAVYVYYAQPPVAIESNAGLTDTFIAHQPIAVRGRPGHEKQAPDRYLLARGVNFVFRGKVNVRNIADSLQAIRFGDFESRTIVYKRELMDHLRQYPEIKFIDFPVWLDDFIRRMPTLSTGEVAEAYSFFRKFYFDHNDDLTRQLPFVERLGR